MKSFLVIGVLLMSLSFVAGASCVTSSEEYAVEVVIPQYSLANVPSNNERLGQGVAFPAQYDASLIVLLEELGQSRGVSVRLQLPTEIEENREPYLKLLSNSAQGTVKDNLASSIGRWQVDCSSSECRFNQGSVILDASTLPGRSEVTLEISSGLAECSEQCSGICIPTPTSSRCVSKNQKKGIDDLLRLTNISDDLEELLDSYRIVGTEDLVIVDIVPTTSPYVSWQEAMRQELVFLNARGVIDISQTDLEAIVTLTRRGQAGHNYRIVFDEENDDWRYYDRSSNPVLSSERDCIAYTSLEGESPKAVVEKNNAGHSIFVLVPIIIAISGVVLIGILALVARLVHTRSAPKPSSFSRPSNLQEWNGENVATGSQA